MGAGASVNSQEVSGKLAIVSDLELVSALSGLDDQARRKLQAALDGDAKVAVTSPVDAGDDKIPEAWGWPQDPYEPEDLKEYVFVATQATQDEKWSEALEARAIDSKKEDHVAEKAFANLMLNKEHTGEAPKQGIDPNAYKKGLWYRFLNHSGECYVYVHNYTRDITATRPDNFTELTEDEKKRLRKLGVYIKELPREIERIYDKMKKIPIIYGSAQTCEALKTFFLYDKGHTLLDCTNLKRVNSKALEDSRQAIVNSMKLGTTLSVYLTDNIPDLQEKICITKHKDSFPRAVFRHGGLDNDMVKEKIYRDEDKEGGEYVVRAGFRVIVVLPYDSMLFEHSSMRKEELPAKIPDFQDMEEVKVYNDDDKKKVLEAMLRGGEM